MKFSQMKYERPDAELLKEQLKSLTERMAAAASYEEAREVFLEMEKLASEVMTVMQIASIRHTIDTRDEFYDAEQKWWDNTMPEMQVYLQSYKMAMLGSPFREDFAKEYGELMFVNAEMQLKTFSPEIVPLLQQENMEANAYEKLLASAQIPFEGKIYTLSQLTPFKTDADDGRRLAAWKAEGQWYMDNAEALDEHYDKLTKLRDEMGRKLGYEGYTTLGYYRMTRNCYDKNDVERFRKAVREYIVPIAERSYREQAERLGVEYPLSYADAALSFRSGNPRPKGSSEEIVQQAREFYEDLSPETGEFFNTMIDNELLDLLSTEGKASGGYCTSLPEYKCPFIFANFNGTQGDIEVVTHEAGHAFQSWMNRERVPLEYQWATLEACEVHSMSMEFFAWNWADVFFGEDADKFRYSHLAGALHFIPYGTMVDHFQHEVYAHPEMTPAERHACWRSLQGIYTPWLRLDGDIPFYSDGRAWQRQHHIYSMPFYYIDYCLAQAVALQFWAMIQKDREAAWEKYMAYTVQGGSDTFVNMLESAGLDTPFDESFFAGVAAAAEKWLDEFDPKALD